MSGVRLSPSHSISNHYNQPTSNVVVDRMWRALKKNTAHHHIPTPIRRDQKDRSYFSLRVKNKQRDGPEVKTTTTTTMMGLIKKRSI
jgi:hypothetical protein